MVQRFFEEREDQSEVKARIVSKYFGVWAKIVLPFSKCLSANILNRMNRL
jgi:hypothetical protein